MIEATSRKGSGTANLTDAEPSPERLCFDGHLTVRSIAPLHATLVAALAEHRSVVVDASGAESVDLSFPQLLLAARRTAIAAGGTFRLAAPASGALRSALEKGGFLAVDATDPFWTTAP